MNCYLFYLYLLTFLKFAVSAKWIVGTNWLEQLSTTFRESAFILINMDKYRYPRYTSLRSGLVSIN